MKPFTLEEVEQLDICNHRNCPDEVCLENYYGLLETARAALRVVEAAKGLSYGADWNKGTHAILHGYRQKLLDNLAPFRTEEK